MEDFEIIVGDALQELRKLPDQYVNCWVTSPPYWGLRDYGVDGQLGLEKTPEEYVSKMVEIFREARRVLRDDGTLWLNLGDSYNSIGHKKSGSGYGTTGLAGGRAQEHTPLRRENSAPGLKHKDLVGIPWMVAFALRADGWYLRQDIIWHKPNPMPESVKDRCTKSHEYIFLMSKSKRYYCDMWAVKEPAAYPSSANSPGSIKSPYGQGFTRKNLTVSDKHKDLRSNIESRHRAPINGGQSLQAEPDGYRNKRSVWTIPTKPFPQAHFATFPPALVEPCILAGCPEGGVVGDMFAGSGTTGIVALKHFRRFIGIELNVEYAYGIALPRLQKETQREKGKRSAP